MIAPRHPRTVHFNARLPRALSEDLKRYAERRRMSASAAAVELLEEALREETFPGIAFRWTSIGRQPVVSGTGMSVWELYHVWLDHGRSVPRVLKGYPHLKAAQVRAAEAYARAYPKEEPPGSWGRRPPGLPVVKA